MDLSKIHAATLAVALIGASTHLAGENATAIDDFQNATFGTEIVQMEQNKDLITTAGAGMAALGFGGATLTKTMDGAKGKDKNDNDDGPGGTRLG